MKKTITTMVAALALCSAVQAKTWIFTVSESLQGGDTTAANGFSVVETGTTNKQVSVTRPLSPGPDNMFFRFQANQ